MANLHSLQKIVTKKKKRVGRGYGSGRGGHTSGRGTKGQKARGRLRLYFEGGQLPLMRRLPMLRGKGKFKSKQKKPVIVNLKYLNLLPKNSTVDIKTLVKANIIKEAEAKKYGVKILGDGEIKIPLIIKLPISKSAQKKIEKAGGEVIDNKPKTKNQKHLSAARQANLNIFKFLICVFNF